jgi:hypothetical protein
MNSLDSKSSTITAKILQSSFNLNYKNASLKISHPNTDAQTWGRVNRFGNKPNGEIYMVKEFDDIIFKKNILGFQKTISRWHSFLKSKITDIGEYTIRDLLSVLYDEFWKNEENLNVAYQELYELVKDCQNELKDWFPFRGQYNRAKGEKRRGNNGKYGFRGQTLLLSAAVVDNQGHIISQLVADDLLSVSSNFEISFYKKVIQSPPGKGDKINIFKNIKIFNYTKYSKKAGYLDERPFLCSHHNEEVNEKIKHILEVNEATKLHRYYHEFLGLISSNAFEKLKKKF